MRGARPLDHPTSEGAALPPVDRLLLGALAALSAVAAAVHPRPAPFLALFGALALFVVAAARFATRSRLGEVLHVFGPLAVIVIIYQSVGFLVGASTADRWDAALATFDRHAFGPLVGAWRGALGRPAWLTDLLSLFYVSYYVVPLAMAVRLYRRGRRDELEELVFALQLTLLVTYLGYFLFPATGPRVPADEAAAVLGGGVASGAVRAFLRSCELNVLDAFPSGHTSVALAFLALGWRMLPGWRVALATLAAGIVISTVYLSHHYVVDVVAGALLTAGVLAAAAPLRRALGAAPRGRLAARTSP